MYTYLAPNLTSWIRNRWILWFEKSNYYTVINADNYAILKLFFEAKNKSEFIDTLSRNRNIADIKALSIFNDLERFLIDSNQVSDDKPKPYFEYDVSNRHYSKNYVIYGINVQINFDSEIVLNLIHPSLSHLQVDSNIPSKNTFDIVINNDMLCLFLNEEFINAFPKKSYHLLQGKFIMLLLCVLHKNKEEDWLGLFHASTVSNGNEAIMCVGQSGSGKSTLATLLMCKGYELVSDDVSPMLFKNNLIYSYPGAISIKKGSFDSVTSLLPNFGDLPKHFINNSKGHVKYVSPLFVDTPVSYPCKKVVLINYSDGNETKLEEIGLDEALQILISDSWISPKEKHAKSFLSWVNQLSFYKLSYSNSNEAITEFSGLFE